MNAWALRMDGDSRVVPQIECRDMCKAGMTHTVDFHRQSGISLQKILVCVKSRDLQTL